MRTYPREDIGKICEKGGVISDLYTLDAGTKFTEMTLGFRGMILTNGKKKYVCVYKSYKSDNYTRVLLSPFDPYNIISIKITEILSRRRTREGGTPNERRRNYI